MKPKSLEGVLESMKDMMKVEAAFAKFYERCAQIWEEDAKFWLSLANQEREHAKSIKRMAEIIAKKYASFEVHRPFSPAAMKTIIANVEKGIVRLEEHGLSKQAALTVARDFELSLIEARYNEIVKTKDMEYLELVNRITAQTNAHRELIDKKIEEAGKK